MLEVAFILAFAMAAVHFLGEEIEERIGGYRERIVSFSSGVSITYIFVQLMPEFHRIAAGSSELIFVFPLLGFSSIHILEKYVAKADISEEAMRKDYSEIHFAFLLLYHGAMGYLIASLLTQNFVSGLLFFIPVILHLAVSSLSVTELHERFASRTWVKVMASAAPLIGVILQRTASFGALFKPILGLVLGMFFYVVVRDSIPEGSKGLPREYVLGALLYLAVILGSNLIL